MRAVAGWCGFLHGKSYAFLSKNGILLGRFVLVLLVLLFVAKVQNASLGGGSLVVVVVVCGGAVGTSLWFWFLALVFVAFVLLVLRRCQRLFVLFVARFGRGRRVIRSLLGLVCSLYSVAGGSWCPCRRPWSRSSSGSCSCWCLLLPWAGDARRVPGWWALLPRCKSQTKDRHCHCHWMGVHPLLLPVLVVWMACCRWIG